MCAMLYQITINRYVIWRQTEVCVFLDGQDYDLTSVPKVKCLFVKRLYYLSVFLWVSYVGYHLVLYSQYSLKSKETKEVTYTCRYSSGHLIPNSSRQDELGIKCPLEISAGVGDFPCFLTFLNYIDCKITNFFLYLFAYFFYN